MQDTIAPPTLPQEWLAWVDENVQRGCTPETLVADMSRHGIDPVLARSAVQRAMSARGKGVDTPAAPAPASHTGSYDHSAPRLVAGHRIPAGDRTVEVLARHNRPVVAVLADVLSAAECDEVIRRARTKLTRSSVVDPATGRDATIADRSSEGTYFERQADPFIAALEARVSTLMGLPLEHGEPFAILHYGPGGEYKPHFDFFPPADPGSAPHLARGGQRVSTLVIYLNDVEAGGSTIFPEIALEVAPRKGSAVYFEYVDPHGQLDRLTLHGGAPVTTGEKWIMTKWMRAGPYQSAD